LAPDDSATKILNVSSRFLQGDPRLFGKGDAFDNYPTVKPKK